MQSRNPVFNSKPEFGGQRRGEPTSHATAAPYGGGYGGYAATDLNEMYNQPPATPAEMGRMTLDDVIMRTATMFAVLLVGAAVGWMVPILGIVGFIVGLVLALVISWKSSTNAAMILSYAAFEGLFVGAISNFYSGYAAERGSDNIVGQAVLGTLVAFASMLFLFKTGKLRATPKFTKGLLVAGLAYFIISMASFVASMFGVGDGWGFRTGGLGLLLCVAGVAIASLFLILDFDFIEKGIAQGLPQRYAWLGAFGLVVTLVWLYLEFLRLFAILSGDD